MFPLLSRHPYARHTLYRVFLFLTAQFPRVHWLDYDSLDPFQNINPSIKRHVFCFQTMFRTLLVCGQLHWIRRWYTPKFIELQTQKYFPPQIRHPLGNVCSHLAVLPSLFINQITLGYKSFSLYFIKRSWNYEYVCEWFISVLSNILL